MTRMQSVDAIRAHQRDWLAQTRERAQEGEPFVICTSDEFEELLSAMGIPVLVINYWNFVLLSQRKGRHFTQVLNEHGYPGQHFFGLGYASSLDPDEAPWGGLPAPAAIIASARNDYEARATELWAQHLGVPFLQIDLNFQGPFKRTPPDDWWSTIRTGWRNLVDPDQLRYRVAANERVLSELTQLTGSALDPERYVEFCRRLNEQMDVMTQAAQVIADAENPPISLRDQVSAYQMMWHRGTEVGLTLAKNYLAELRERVRDGITVHADPKYRVLFWSNAAEPAVHEHLRETHDAVIVGSPYLEMPAMYARDFDDDPREAVAAKQLFLFDFRSRSWLKHAVRRHRADIVIAIEDRTSSHSVMAQTCAEIGVPFFALRGGENENDEKERIDRFFAELAGSAA